MRSRGCFLRYAKTDLGRIFEKKYAGKHFCERRFPNQAHLPKAFPLGGRCPSAHTGADEGAIDSPNGAGGGKRRGDRLIFLQGKVGYRIAPSSVTFGDSFPQGEASGLWSPTRKSVPNQGMYMGTVIAYRPEQCGTTAKTSECQRAGPKLGGRGASPRDSLRPGFL